MRALVQRVSQARVTVSGAAVADIGPGLLVFVGVTHDDTEATATKLADKIGNLRVFDDAEGIMNRSLLDVGGEALVVSQFTLYGDTTRGRRPSWVAAAAPEVAEPVCDAFAARLHDVGLRVETGRFRADMQVSLVNDGPVTLMLEQAASQ